MLQVPKGSLEDLVLLVSQVRAQLAVAAIRQQARQRGQETMTAADADQLVQRTRRERKQKSPGIDESL
jgi:hypothetical protein